MSDHLVRPSELEGVWNVGSRRVRELIGELEGLGFRLEKDLYGARLVRRELAIAVAQARALDRPLATLLDRAELRGFLTADAREDVIGAVIKLRSELAVVREVLGEVWRCASTAPGVRTDFHALGLPDARGEL